MASFFCWFAGKVGERFFGFDDYHKEHPLQSLANTAFSDDPPAVRRKKAEQALSIMPIAMVKSLYESIAEYAQQVEKVEIEKGKEVLWGRDHAVDNMIRLAKAVERCAVKALTSLEGAQQSLLRIKSAEKVHSGKTRSPLEARIAALYEMEVLTTSYKSDMHVIRWVGDETANVFSRGVCDPDYGRIYYVNGIDNTRARLFSSIEQLSEMLDGCKVYGLHNPSHGLLFDVFEAMMNRSGKATPPVRVIQRELLEYLSSAPETKKAVIYCHSQGCLLMKLVIENWPQEHMALLDRLEVHAFAPAAYVSDRAIHYVIDSDWVPTFFSEGVERLTRPSANVLHLPPHQDGSYPHAFFGSSYRDYMTSLHFHRSPTLANGSTGSS